MIDKSFALPLSFFDVHYDGHHYPGNAQGLSKGANCQHFAYEVLRYFGFQIPDFRSCQLWNDKTHTRRVKNLKPLDLLLFNKTEDPYGAHVCLYTGKDRILHLCKEIGYPTVWDFAQFDKRERYKTLIGAKRVKV